jgi:hypothetical protein
MEDPTSASAVPGLIFLDAFSGCDLIDAKR